MTVRNLKHLLNPRSLVVVGASMRPGSVGAVTFANVLAAGFAGRVYAVNPRHHTVAGHQCYRSVTDLPEVPELAVICTPAATVPGIVHELAGTGCKAAVVLSAGLSATDSSGRSLRQAMLDAARPALLRVLGPNCLGLLAPTIGLNASFAPANALPGRIALVSQSGGVLTALLDWANQRNIGFSRLVSLGEACDVDAGDMLDFLAADPATDAILLYVESLAGARKFMSAARSAARAKPTIFLKAGRHPKAAQAAFSHTGALAGADLVYDAAIRRAGALRVSGSADLFGAVEMLSQRCQPAGPRLAIVTNGGGPGILATDALESAGGCLAELSADTQRQLDKVLPTSWSKGNPVDIVGDAPPARYCDALTVLLASGNADAVLLIHAPTAIAGSSEIARAILPLIQQAPIPVLTSWLGGASVAEARRLCAASGVPAFDNPESAVEGFLQMVRYRESQRLLMQLPATDEVPAARSDVARALVAAHLAAGRCELGMLECAPLLAAYGIGAPAQQVVDTLEQATEAAQRIGYPVALKAIAAGASHKTEVGALALDLCDRAALTGAMSAMRERLASVPGIGPVTGFLVQAMVKRAHARELIAGINTDPLFGPVILFGRGGIETEVLPDRAVALPPLNQVLAADLVGRTQVARLLDGFRGRPPVQLHALHDALVGVAQMAADLPELAELDINPLLADEHGVIALDARARLAPQPRGTVRHARLAILPYPDQLVEHVAWQGAGLVLRPIRPEDAPAHQAFFARLEPEDVHFRMFASMRALSPAQLARLTQIDYGREMAFVAVRQSEAGIDETLGEARIAADPDHVRGEFAVIVRSDLKGQGLGRMLMECLLRYCRASGLQEVEGTVLADNAAMLGLARSLGFIQAPARDGLVTVRLQLGGTNGAEGAQ